MQHRLFAPAFALAWVATAHAQYGTPETLKAELKPLPGLTYPHEVQVLSANAALNNGLFAAPLKSADEKRG